MNISVVFIHSKTEYPIHLPKKEQTTVRELYSAVDQSTGLAPQSYRLNSCGMSLPAPGVTELEHNPVSCYGILQEGALVHLIQRLSASQGTQDHGALAPEEG